MMRFIRTVYYVLKQGLKSICKNLFMVSASVVVVFATLLMMGGLWAISENIQFVVEQYKERPDIRINLHSYIEQEEAEELKAVLEKDGRVKSVVLITKEETRNNIINFLDGDGAGIFEGHEESPALNYISFDIMLEAYTDGAAFKAEAEKLVSVDNVRDTSGFISKLEVVLFWIRIGTVAATVAMAVLSVLLIFNTVKLTVFARKREIEIMKYIGASDWYICGPFVIEGVFTGLVGAVLAYFMLGGICNGLYKTLTQSNFLGDTISLLAFKDIDVNFLLWYILAGVATGVIASLWAIRKHVNV